MSQEKRIYTGIDLFKLIAACLVVLLHAVETTEWYSCEIKYAFTRLAVPFFFLASGFFLYKGLNRAESPRKYIIKYEKNLIKIFMVWAVLIYSPFTISSYIEKYAGSSPIIISSVVFRRMFVIGPGPYWYLIAMMWSAAFLYVCYTKKSRLLLYSGIAAGLILEVLYSCFQRALSGIALFHIIFRLTYGLFSWEYNFLMFGIPFMGLGYLIAQRDWNMSAGKAAGLLLASTAISILEYNLPILLPGSFWDGNKISFAFIIQAFAYFMLAKNLKLVVSRQVSANWRQLSSWIYFLHAILLYNILNPLMDRFTNLPTYAPIMILPKVLVVLSVCTGLFGVIKKANNRYLNVLLNG